MLIVYEIKKNSFFYQKNTNLFFSKIKHFHTVLAESDIFYILLHDLIGDSFSALVRKIASV